jgi:hypothetical protein
MLIFFFTCYATTIVILLFHYPSLVLTDTCNVVQLEIVMSTPGVLEVVVILPFFCNFSLLP